MVEMILVGKVLDMVSGIIDLNFGTATIKATPEHLFLVGGKAVKAKDILVGSTVFM